MNNYIYILVMGLVSYIIRVVPLTLIRRPIENRFIRSFLFYVPYVTLAVMTVPAIFQATQLPIAGVLAFIVACILAYLGRSLMQVAAVSVIVVYVLELLLLKI
ncbi:AzlD domain-containing protein [Aerococcaceae bacterium DSM 111176]|nr:AzlD domain-containing protein [Aerococcaceae bacterium DSM 111176]